MINNTQKLLAFTLSLVLVAGMTSPAFAGMDPKCNVDPPKALLEISQKDGSDFVDKKITCNTLINDYKIGDDCKNYDAFILNDNLDDNFVTFTEQVTNFGGLVEEHCTVTFSLLTRDGPVDVKQELWITQPQPVAGEILPLDSSALVIGGLASSAVWMIPAVAGVAGVGIYLVKFRRS